MKSTNPQTKASLSRQSSPAGRASSIDEFPIAGRFSGWTRRSPEQGDCRCPAHDDSRASLSVGLGDDGTRLTLQCHAGCNTGDVLRAVGGLWSDLFYQSAVARPEKKKRGNVGGSGGSSNGAASRIVATYDYRSPEGRLIFQVVRFDPKDFRQRHRDLATGRWIWKGVSEADRVLFQLPELLAAPADQPIFLCEGEKDAENLRSLGFIATTAPGGAAGKKGKAKGRPEGKGKWLPQYSESLRGRIVIIVPDSDPAGRRHALAVARALHGIAAHVAILELPLPTELPPRIADAKPIDPASLPAKWDVTDWILAGGSSRQFAAAVDQALQRPFDPESPENQDPDDQDEESPDDGLPEICNAEYIADKLIPINIAEISRRIKESTDDWPRRVGAALFIDRPSASSGHSMHWLERSSQLFAFIGRETSTPPTFHRLPGAHTKEEVFASLQQSATSYQAVEILPHEPPIPSHYYACDIPEPGNGDSLLGLVQRFSPATPIDCDLILCMFATLVWGGPGGSRPAFVITSDDGRGVGKSKMAGLVAHLAGGVIEISANEDSSKMKERLLSPEGLIKRVALLDNVKTLRFSWAELEALITSPIVSGKRLYVGEASRPNNLTWIITLNGVSLSTDMAQRAVVVKIRRPTHSGDWEESVRQYIDEHRQAIIGDLIAFLRGPRAELMRYTRWGAWERAILSLTERPDEVQDEIIARQASSDVEEEDASLIVEFFRERLKELLYDTETDAVFIPSRIASDWLCRATGEKHSVTGGSRMLKQKCEEGAILEIKVNRDHGKGRGFVWHPEKKIGDVHMNLMSRFENPPEKVF